jgi:hypothetical protein
MSAPVITRHGGRFRRSFLCWLSRPLSH